MAGKRWPSTGYLPGMSPFPDGARMPAKRKPLRISRKRVERSGIRGIRADVAIIDDPHVPPSEIADVTRTLQIEHLYNKDGSIAGSVLWVPRPREPRPERGRPVTYDHPLALAARAGRKHALWSGPVPVFATAEERRAFEMGRARKLAWRRGER